jgi:predicted metallopeptidase
MDMGKYFPCKWGKHQLFQESFQKNPPVVTPILYIESNRHYVEKLCAKGENRKMFHEIMMDMGKYFSCKWGKNRLFQESFQKNPLEVTPILFLELNRHHV